MRKLPLVAVASLLLFAACGDDSGSGDSTETTVATESAAGENPVPATTAGVPTTRVGSLPKPSVAPPASEPTELIVTDLSEGTGEPAANGDQVIVHYVGVRSVDGLEFDNSYDRGEAFPITLGAGGVIAGWDQGLVGVKAGGQRRLDIPSDLAYGAESRSEEIRADEDLTFVIDVLAVIKPVDPAAEPALTITPVAPVTAVASSDLVEGTGPAAESGDTATFVYIFFRGDTGAKLFSSWDQQPASALLDPEVSTDPLVDAVAVGLVGMKVGGRRQLTVPASMVFNGLGSEEAGLPAGVDVVMVVDLLATY